MILDEHYSIVIFFSVGYKASESYLKVTDIEGILYGGRTYPTESQIILRYVMDSEGRNW